MPRWHLFVDESGNFDNCRQGVVVAGVLLDLEGPPLKAILARWFRTHLPHVPPPPHMAHLNHGMSQVVWCHEVPGRLKALRPPRAQAISQALSWLDESSRILLDEAGAASAAHQGRADIGEYLNPLRERLRTGDFALWRSLDKFALDDQRVVAAIFRVLQQQPDLPLVGIVAGECWQGAAYDEPDRYLCLLGTLLEHVFAVLSQRVDQAELAIHVLGRRVADEQNPVRNTYLTRQRVLELASPFCGPHLVGDVDVATWGPSMDPRLVLADVLSNKTRIPIAGNRALARVQQMCEERLGTRLDVGAGGLPTCFGAPTLQSLTDETRTAEGLRNHLAHIIEEHHVEPFAWAAESANLWLPPRG